MVSQGHPSGRDHPSIKCRSVPLDLSPIELVDNGQADNVNSQKSNNILSTTGLVVVAGRIWNFLNQPSDILQSKENLKQISACKNKSLTSSSDGNAKASILAGVTGLYRGISSNIASSAPISAVSHMNQLKGFFCHSCQRNTILSHIAEQAAVLVLLLHLFLLLVSVLSSRCKLVHAIRTVGAGHMGELGNNGDQPLDFNMRG